MLPTCILSFIPNEVGLFVIYTYFPVYIHLVQIVPGWAGWELKRAPQSYMLRTLQNATRTVDQRYSLLTYDLVVAKKAYFTRVAPLSPFGVFYTLGSYMAARGKIMRGSGFADIVIESGVCVCVCEGQSNEC